MSDVIEQLYGDRVPGTNIVFTPENVVEEMLGRLPEDFWTPNKRILDICSKSGRFLKYAFNKLYNSPYLSEMTPNERKKHIIENQLFGMSNDFTCLVLAETTLYGFAQYGKRNIKLVSNLEAVVKRVDRQSELGKETGFDMHFDLVVGNPPYNKGMDLDFIDLGYELSEQYTVMIVPAKWQTADANQRISSKMSYGQFREKLVPHIKYVCFYPDCLDVFGIQEQSGVSWFILDKSNTYENSCTVENKCNLQKYANGIEKRDITHRQTLWNIGNKIIEHLNKGGGQYKSYEFSPIEKRKEYTLNMNSQMALGTCSSGAWDFDMGGIKKSFIGKGGVLFNQSGQLNLTNKTRLLKYDEKSGISASKDVFTSDDIDECKSFYTWINSKFTRFFILINISSLTILNDNTFRFVPCPPNNSFDHLYTDEELYDWFNLPEEYRVVIDSILRDRK